MIMDWRKLVRHRTPHGRYRSCWDSTVSFQRSSGLRRPQRRQVPETWTSVNDIDLLRKQVVAQPGSAKAQNELAVGLYASGQRDAAIATLEQAAELAPDWDLPHENLALALRERGELPAAQREAQLAETLRKPVGASPGPREAPGKAPSGP